MNGSVLDSPSRIARPVADGVAECDAQLTKSHGADAARLQIPPAASAPFRSLRSRRITPQAGRALEILGHAIDYLIDEWIHVRGKNLSPDDPQAEAIYLLMKLNREIYDDCPPVFTLMERLESTLLRFLGFKTVTGSPKHPKEDLLSRIYPNRS